MDYFHMIAEQNIQRLREEQARKKRAEEEDLKRHKELRCDYLFGRYSFEDFSVRKNGRHVESYCISTGETLFTAGSEEEAWKDLREEFGRN